MDLYHVYLIIDGFFGYQKLDLNLTRTPEVFPCYLYKFIRSRIVIFKIMSHQVLLNNKIPFKSKSIVKSYQTTTSYHLHNLIDSITMLFVYLITCTILSGLMQYK